MLLFVFVFFKQKTAYEMRISDWSSDVCSSDLAGVRIQCEPAFGNRMGEHDRIDCWEGGVAVTICHQSWSLNGLDLLVPVSLIPEEGRGRLVLGSHGRVPRFDLQCTPTEGDPLERGPSRRRSFRTRREVQLKKVLQI